jgi:hypothetical protein
LYGRLVRVERVDNRAAGAFVDVEVLPSVVTVVATSMLDASACAGMEIGPPRASLSALRDLYDLLKKLGLRRSCSVDSPASQEQSDAAPPKKPSPRDSC